MDSSTTELYAILTCIVFFDGSHEKLYETLKCRAHIDTILELIPNYMHQLLGWVTHLVDDADIRRHVIAFISDSYHIEIDEATLVEKMLIFADSFIIFGSSVSDDSMMQLFLRQLLIWFFTKKCATQHYFQKRVRIYPSLPSVTDGN